MNDTLLTSAEMRTFNTRLAALTSGRLVVGPDPITRSQARALWQATKAFAAPVAAPVAALAPVRSPRRRVNELHRTGAVVAISAVALSGCATLGGNVKGSFACRAPDGICAPTSTIDDQALAMISGADPEATPAGVINPYDRGDPRLTLVSASATPMRSSEKVLRIVFPAHIDGAGRYREASAIHAVVERGAWMAAADRPARVVVGAVTAPPREQVAMLAEAPSLAELAAASPEVAYAQPADETPVALAAVPPTASGQNIPNAPSAAAIAAARLKLHAAPSGKPAVRAVSFNTPTPLPVVAPSVSSSQYAANIQARVSPALVVQPALPRPATASSSPRPSLVSVPSSVSSFDLRNAGTAFPLTTIRDQVSSILARTPKSPVAAVNPSATERPVNGPSVLAVSGVEK